MNLPPAFTYDPETEAWWSGEVGLHLSANTAGQRRCWLLDADGLPSIRSLPPEQAAALLWRHGPAAGLRWAWECFAASAPGQNLYSAEHDGFTRYTPTPSKEIAG